MMDKEYLHNTNSKPWLPYRIVILLTLGGDIQVQHFYIRFFFTRAVTEIFF